MLNRRTTLQDIAEVCGCSKMTVSLALRDHHSISAQRREKIQATAKRLDYAPDPTLAALAAYRRARYPKPTAPPLAWVTNYPSADSWTRESRFGFVNQYFKGAMQRTREIGYQIDHFWLREKGMTPQRLSRILYSRGITGILLPPQPVSFAHLNLDWERFSSVTFGYSLARPRLHMATTHHYRSMSMVMRKLLSLGYRRIGFVLTSVNGARVHHNYYASYVVEQGRLPARFHIPPLYTRTLTRTAMLKWFRKYKPEAIITGASEFHQVLLEEGVRIPEDIGFALLGTGTSIEAAQKSKIILSGADENLGAVGRAAVDLLVSLMHNHERGIPEIPSSVLIDSKWTEGCTVRRVNLDPKRPKLYT